MNRLLLNIAGAICFCKNRGFDVYSTNKTWARRIMFITKENVVSRLSSCSSPSQPLLKPLLWGENCFMTMASGSPKLLSLIFLPFGFYQAIILTVSANAPFFNTFGKIFTRFILKNISARRKNYIENKLGIPCSVKNVKTQFNQFNILAVQKTLCL
jgi:hypothetical protein